MSTIEHYAHDNRLSILGGDAFMPRPRLVTPAVGLIHQRGILIGVRGAAEHIVNAASARGVRAEFVDTPEAAGEWLAREVKPGDLVLLKASRGVKLEKALENWKTRIP